MKNKIKSALMLVLCAVMLFGAGGCNTDRDHDSSLDSGKDNIEYTDYDFIQNSGSEYTIVLPAENLYNERLAADEINSFVFEDRS